MDTHIVLLYVTCKDRREARVLGGELLNKGLVACVNILPTTESYYFWQAEGSERKIASTESILLAKTISGNERKIDLIIRKLHSYEIPAILFFAADWVSPKYKKWVQEQVQSNNKKHT